MACGARSGLKLVNEYGVYPRFEWLNGLWSPFGFETQLCDHVHAEPLAAKWPVEPVRV